MAFDHWNTPPEIVSAVHDAFGDAPDLDPCSNPGSIVGAHRSVMLPDDGLAVKWLGNVYVNPPYSNPSPWLQKAAESVSYATTIAVVNVATATEYWHKWVWPWAESICFFRGRIAFMRDGKPHSGNRYEQAAILYCGSAYTDIKRDFLDAFSPIGYVVEQ